jgi:hypothetical protein
MDERPGSAAILAVIFGAFFFWVDRLHSDLLSRLRTSLLYGFGIACIPLVGALPTCAFSIRVDPSSVQHVFLGRFILSHRSLDDLRAVKIASGSWGAVLEFENQPAIRFFGAGLAELRSISAPANMLPALSP